MNENPESLSVEIADLREGLRRLWSRSPEEWKKLITEATCDADDAETVERAWQASQESLRAVWDNPEDAAAYDHLTIDANDPPTSNLP